LILLSECSNTPRQWWCLSLFLIRHVVESGDPVISIVFINANGIFRENDRESAKRAAKRAEITCPGEGLMSLLRVLPSTLQKLGLARIDPVPWRDVTLPFPKHYGDGNVKLTKLQIGGFSRFTIDDFCNSTGTHDVELNIPVLNVVGHYQLDGKILGLFPMHRSGEVQIQIQDLALTILILINNRNPIGSAVKVTNAELNVGDIEAYIQNLEGEERSVKKEVYKLIDHAFQSEKAFLIQYVEGVLQLFFDNTGYKEEPSSEEYADFDDRPVMPPWMDYGRYPKFN